MTEPTPPTDRWSSEVETVNWSSPSDDPGRELRALSWENNILRIQRDELLSQLVSAHEELDRYRHKWWRKLRR